MGHSLIDKAVEVCGSRYKVAKRIRVSEATLSTVYRGKAPLSPEVAAKLADVAGMDAMRAAAVAIIEREPDPLEREVLRGVFFPAHAVVMLLFSISAVLSGLFATSDAKASPSRVALETSCKDTSLYIMLTARLT